MDQTQQRQQHAGDGAYDGDVPPASAQAQQAAGLGKKHEQQQQQHAGDGYEGGVPAPSAHAQQAAAGLRKKHEEEEEERKQASSSLNPTAARLLREAIVSQPDGGEPAAAVGSSDILAFSRAVDRVDSPLE